MVTMDYIQHESSNQSIIVPHQDENIQYNNTKEGGKLVFIDMLSILFCIFSVLPAISMCLYSRYIKHNNIQNNEQINPIDNLQSLIITNQPYVQLDDICTICLDEFEFEEELIKLKCHHIFHKECLKPWLDNNKNKCPICRANIN